MINQGDILINFNPQLGHEQSGYRPVLVVSNNHYHKMLNLVLACPITNSDRSFPLYVSLNNRSTITGFILCDQIRALDLKARRFKLIEKVIKIIIAELKLEE